MTKLHQTTGAGLLLCALSAITLTGTGAHANAVADPGFEGALTADGPPFVGFWESFSLDGDQDTGPDIARTSTTNPRSGSQHLELQIDAIANSFTGVFQDIAGLIPGTTAEWSGWTLEAVGSDVGGSEIRIEFRDSINDVEISRTPNLAPSFTQGQYEFWSVSETVPAGADTARLVYAIQSFGGGPDQLIYVDDVSFVPEPASLALLGLGGLTLLRRRT